VQLSNRLSLATALGFALIGAGPSAAAGASRSSTACLDSSSPSYAVDRQVVAGIARYGDRLTPFVYDGSVGVSERFFRYLSRTKCALIMGYPVDLASPDPPDGLALTESYMSTAYVMASRRNLTQSGLAGGMTVAVGVATAPHFYLAGAFGRSPDVTTDTFQTQEQVLDALAKGQAVAAMVWEPSLVRYAATHGQARAWHLSALHVPHARWKIAALYVEGNAAEAARFNGALRQFERSGGLAAVTRPYALENVR